MSSTHQNKKKRVVYILLPVHLCTVLANDQLDNFFNVFIYFTSLHISNSTVFIIRISIVLIHQLVCIGLCRWLLGIPVYRSMSSWSLARIVLRCMVNKIKNFECLWYSLATLIIKFELDIVLILALSWLLFDTRLFICC